MFTHYSVAVAAVLVLLSIAVYSGARLTELMTGLSTGLAATAALVFVVKSIYDDADRRRRAPGTLAALHSCVLIFNDFRYLWLNMANSLNLEHGGKWYEKEILDNIEKRLTLQAQASNYDLPFVRRDDGSNRAGKADLGRSNRQDKKSNAHKRQ